MDQNLLDLPILKLHSPNVEYINITSESNNELRVHFQLLSNYFVKEFDYSSPPQYANPSLKADEYQGFLFLQQEYDGKLTYTYRAYGACCFSKKPIGSQNHWKLEWVWIHPFFRHRGNLRRLWKYLKQECGEDFFIKKPVSAEMKKFLVKVGGNHIEVL